MLVIACNTATALALDQITSAAHVPVIGVVEPGANAAAAASKNRKTVVIGTQATVSSHAYRKALEARGLSAREKACPLLVPLIEEGLLNDEVTDRMILRYLEPLLEGGVDTLVLGCTHYPLLTGAIARVLRRQIMVVDSAQNCARAVEAMLEQQSIRAAPLNNGQLRVALTDAADNFLNVARDALQLQFGEIEIRALS